LGKGFRKTCFLNYWLIYWHNSCFIHNMKKIFIVLLMILSLSCDNDLCDPENYPDSPLNMPHHVDYGDDYVRYTYVCINGYNEVWNYEIVNGCWETYVLTEYNYLCE